jgi:hypothetical protein
LNVGEVVAPDLAERIKVISTMSTNGAIAVKEEGTTLTNGVKSLNFVGTGITATTSGDDVTVTVASGSGTVTSVAATAGTGISVTGSPITTTGTLTITNTAPDQTVALTQGGTTTITGTYPNFTISSSDQFQGTVTSVTGTSPVASSGGATPAISLSAGYGDTLNPYASKTANFVLSAPNGSAGVPTFRAVVAADIPTLNQNTTGTASNVTGTVAVANGGTGVTTSTGTTNVVLSNSPTLVTPILGAASATSITVAAGAVGTPSITTTGDTNTGIFFPAADTIAFSEGGAEAMRIDSSGNVGIGTSSPANGRLDVVTSSGSAYINVRRNSQSTGEVGLTLYGGTSSNNWTAYMPTSSNDFRLNTAGVDRVTVDSSGNVGIGTTSPAYKLDIASAALPLRLKNTSATSATPFSNPILGLGSNGSGADTTIAFTDSVTWNAYIGMNSGSICFGNSAAAEKMRITQGGYLGIGTTAPVTELSVSGALSFTAVAATPAVGSSFFAPASNTLAFGTASTERMRITSSGNAILGSNTSTTANNILNLYSPTSTLNGIYINKGSQVECQIGFKTGTGTDFFIGTGSTTMGTNGVYLANAGNSWVSISDERQKDIIEPIENALTKVSAMRAVIGKYKHDVNNVRRSFLIAQDVQAVFPEAVKVQDDEEALLGLSYTDVIPLLVAAIKEQQTLITALTARITALESI